MDRRLLKGTTMTKNEITWAIHYKVKRSLKMLAQRCNAIMFELIVGLMWVAFAQKNRKDEFIYIIKYQKRYLKILKEMIKCKKKYVSRMGILQ